jgi:hypothetical protein
MALNPLLVPTTQTPQSAVDAALSTAKATAASLASYLSTNGDDGSASLTALVTAFQIEKNELIIKTNQLTNSNTPFLPVTRRLDVATMDALRSFASAYGIPMSNPQVITPASVTPTVTSTNPVVSVNAPKPVTAINPTAVAPASTTTAAPMTTGTKVAIGVGIAGALALVIYLATKKPARKRKR